MEMFKIYSFYTLSIFLNIQDLSMTCQLMDQLNLYYCNKVLNKFDMNVKVLMGRGEAKSE